MTIRIPVDLPPYLLRDSTNPPGAGGGYRGKFSDDIEELLYVCEHDQEIGSVDELGWYGMVSGLTQGDAMGLCKQNDLPLNTVDTEGYHWPLNAIIRENSDGHIEVETFGPPHANRDMMKVWRGIEKMYEEYDGGDA